MSDRISELPIASEAIAGNDLVAVTNVSQPGTGETQKLTQDQLTASQLNLNFRTATELTIASGAITITQSNHKLQPETGTTDNLETINGMAAGKIAVIYLSDPGTDTITIKHGTDNISCVGEADIVLSNGMIVCYSDGTTVYVSGGGGGGDLVDDLTPQLGGDLDLNGHSILDLNKFVCNGRLTLESGVSVSTAEQVDKTNLYFTPYNGNEISLYDGAAWVRFSFAELTLAVGALTASKPYDIFIYDNAGTLTLSATEWTNASTRATALTTQDGVPVKTGATGYRYLGTIYIDAGQKCQDTLLKGYVWNYYNRVLRRFFMQEATSHTYNGAARLWNNSEVNNRLDIVVGYADYIIINGLARLNAGADASYAFAYFYIDGAISGYFSGNYNIQVVMGGSGMNIPMTAGYHYINIYEAGNHASSNFIAVFTYASLMR